MDLKQGLHVEVIFIKASWKFTSKSLTDWHYPQPLFAKEGNSFEFNTMLNSKALLP